MRTSIEQRAKGSWCIRYDLPRDPNGRRKQRRVTIRGTRRDAEARAAEIVRFVETGTYIEPRKTPLAEYLAEWLNSNTGLATSTARRYRQILSVYLIPSIGNIALSKLTSFHVKQAMQVWPSLSKKTPSGRTLAHVYELLRAALNEAVKMKLIAENPCRSVRAPRWERKEVEILPPEEVIELLNGLGGTNLFFPSLTVVGTGLRRSELLALRWGDCDLDVGVLHVRRCLERSDDGTLGFKSPKTAKSLRAVVLPNFVIEGLRRHFDEQAISDATVGVERNSERLVFSEIDRTPWDPDKFSAAFYYAVRSLRLPRISFHGLRHTYATFMLNADVPMKVTSDLLGHTTITITADLYTHVVTAMQREAAARLNSYFRFALPAVGAAALKGAGDPASPLAAAQQDKA